MIVLLVESYNPVPGHLGHHHGQHELHVPVLVCPEKYVVRGGRLRLPDMTFQPTPYPGNQDSEDVMAVFYLDDQDITIKPDANTELEVELTPVKNCTGSQSSFNWVTPIEEVNPGAETVRDSCFASPGDSSVISRVYLRQGKITTAKLATNLERKILLWKFEEADRADSYGPSESKPKEGRAIAAVVGAHFDLDEEQGIEFTTHLLHNHSSNRRVETVFAHAPGKQLRIRIEPTDNYRKIWIKNVPWPDILQVRNLRNPKRDDHFAHIYKLSKNSASVAKKVPYTKGETCLGDSGFDNRHGAGTDCPHALMKR